MSENKSQASPRQVRGKSRAGLRQVRGKSQASLRQVEKVQISLRDVICPTLILRGSDSRNLPTATLTEMVALCPRAHGLEIPAAGHHVFLDNPAAFLQAVRRFLGKEKEGSPCKS